MKLVEDDHGNVFQCRVVEQHTGEYALRHHLNPRFLRDLALKADAVANGLANGLVEQPCHTLRYLPCSHSAGFQHDDLACPVRQAFQNRQWQYC